MLNRYSNIATSDALKNHFKTPFNLEYLYNPQLIIDGKKENSVALITSNEPENIQLGIWGILPHLYDDGWKEFQKNLSTLETSVAQLKSSIWLNDAFQKRRCLIMSTGYYTSQIKNHKIVFTYHSLANNDIFCFAGIYNILDDGFITFSILSRELDNGNILEKTSPIMLDSQYYNQYLTDAFPLKKLIEKKYEIETSLVKSHGISKKHLKNKTFQLLSS